MLRHAGFLLLLGGLVGAGCVTRPRQNRPLEVYRPQEGYRYANLAPGKDNSDSLLVVLTFSGGGTRAAALSFGVLEKLRDTTIVWEGRPRRLLDEVDIVSSVSGGSLTSAYFALYGDRIFAEFPEKVLYESLQGGILRRLLAVRNYPKLFSPFYGRTDLMAETFSERIFGGQTFGDLLAYGHRPYLIINATDIARGSRFEFTQRQFDLLYSDLSSYPIGNAVAASSAFPGMLTPLTVRNFERRDDYCTPSWIRDELTTNDPDRPRFRAALEQFSYIEAGRPYIHLSDGGVSDNLGLLPVVHFLTGASPDDAVRSLVDNGTVKKVVVITVNAKRATKSTWNLSAGVLNMIKVLGAVGTAPMANFSDAQTAYVRAYIRDAEERRSLWQRLVQTLGPERAASEFPDLARDQVDCSFVEVEFSRIADEAERDYLNSTPTAFKLKREQVDRLRRAAGAILDRHPAYQALVAELR